MTEGLPAREARDWCEALTETRDGWHRGYEREQVLRLSDVAAD